MSSSPVGDYLPDGVPLQPHPPSARAWAPLAPVQPLRRSPRDQPATTSDAPRPKLAPLPPRLPASATSDPMRFPPLSPPPRPAPSVSPVAGISAAAATGLSGPTPAAVSAEPPRTWTGSKINVRVCEYHDVVGSSVSHFGGDPLVQANQLVTGVHDDVTIAELLALYQQAAGRRYLHAPFVFIAHATRDESADPTTSEAISSPSAGVAPSESPATFSALSSVDLLRGRLVRLPRSHLSRTLAQLRVASGCTLAVRSQPFPIDVELDNSALLQCGVAETQLDRHAVQVWVQDDMSVSQLKAEVLRQLREHPHLVGASRCRLFVHERPDGPPVEITQQLTRRVASLPLTAADRTTKRTRMSTLLVRKDPTRWLHEAIRADALATAESLIKLGADAHLLDANGHSAFVHARSEEMKSLLQRAFPPSPQEAEAVRQLLLSYEGWLHSGACVHWSSQSLVSRSGKASLVDEERYVFVKRDQAQRALITNQLHKPVGEVDLRASAHHKQHAIVPTALDAPDQGPPIFAAEAGLPEDAATLPPLYPPFDRKPDFLLFSLKLKLIDRVKEVTLRSPAYSAPSRSTPEISSLQSVSRFRAVVTRFDVWKRLYIINLKMAMLLASAASAAYSFSVVLSERGEWGEDEIVAGFVLTMLKALVALLFFARMTHCFGWRVASSFAKIKTQLVAPGNERRLTEAYLYFFVLEMADAGMLVANVRMLASLAAAGVGLTQANFRVPHPEAMSAAQSLQLSIYLSLISLVALNLVDTTISFLADETPWRQRVHRYLALHFVVLVYCFTSLRVTYDFRHFQLDTGLGDSNDLAALLVPTSMSFVFAYLFGLSIKNLNGTFHPGTNHRDMDEQLNAKAVEADYRTSLLYVLLSVVVYSAAQHASEQERDVVNDAALYGVALHTYFVCGLVLSVTALLPLLLRPSGPSWLPDILSWLPDAFTSLLHALPCRFLSHRSRVASSSSSSGSTDDGAGLVAAAAAPQATLRVTVAQPAANTAAG